MRRYLIFIYGMLAFLFAVSALGYAVGFLGSVFVPKTISSGTATYTGVAVLINTVLIGLFGVQHSVMARRSFKAWWTKFVPEAVERSTYVLFTALVLALLYWQWRPLTGVAWSVEHRAVRALLWAGYVGGWLMMAYSAALIDPWDLVGLRQVWCVLRDRSYSPPVFVERSLYRWIRHPLQTGVLIVLWTVPTMTWGHVLFSSLMTLYVFVGIILEERDLVRQYGQAYLEYRRRTPILLPLRRGRVETHVSSKNNSP